VRSIVLIAHNGTNGLCAQKKAQAGMPAPMEGRNKSQTGVASDSAAYLDCAI
jgi:hypothetical protein